MAAAELPLRCAERLRPRARLAMRPPSRGTRASAGVFDRRAAVGAASASTEAACQSKVVKLVSTEVYGRSSIRVQPTIA